MDELIYQVYVFFTVTRKKLKNNITSNGYTAVPMASEDEALTLTTPTARALSTFHCGEASHELMILVAGKKTLSPTELRARLPRFVYRFVQK